MFQGTKNQSSNGKYKNRPADEYLVTLMPVKFKEKANNNNGGASIMVLRVDFSGAKYGNLVELFVLYYLSRVCVCVCVCVCSCLRAKSEANWS